MDYATVLSNIISLLMGGFTSMATKFGDGINDIISHLFFVYSEGAITSGLTVFAALTIIWGAIGLTLGISRVLIKWITGWGKSSRM